ncbi:MAG TPA: hypothetical protein VLX29_01940 [Nitrospirota bacterium]|nr:hypothetical protein [Nitrospirota bacterium]
MKRLLSLKSPFALLIAAAFVLSTGLVSAAEKQGADTEGSYAVESSGSPGSPSMSESAQEPALAEHDAENAGPLTKGEEEDVGKSGGFDVQSSEPTGLPDVTQID